MTDETDDAEGKNEPPKRLKNPRSAARPSYKSTLGPRRVSHQGEGMGAVSLGHLTKWKQRTLKLDKRSTAYLETRRFITAIEADLGGAEALSAAERQIVQHAAIVGAMCTDMEIKYLRGETIDTSEYGFLVGVQHRLFSLIGLRRRPRDVTPSLEDVLRDEKGQP
jgi:hypothetical protein